MRLGTKAIDFELKRTGDQMELTELLGKLSAPIAVRPTRRMTQSELEAYLDAAANILRGNADHSEFRGYVFALLFYKRISDCYDEEVRTQADILIKAGMDEKQALELARDPQNHHFVVPEHIPYTKSHVDQFLSVFHLYWIYRTYSISQLMQL